MKADLGAVVLPQTVGKTLLSSVAGLIGAGEEVLAEKSPLR
jgi:hypothetical protein